MVLQIQSCAFKSCVSSNFMPPPPQSHSPNPQMHTFITKATATKPTVSPPITTSSSSNSGQKLPSIPTTPDSNSKTPSVSTARAASRSLSPLDEALKFGRATAVALCNSVEDFISDFIDPREYPPSQNPKIHMSGNFAPVEECPPRECEVVGTIPACLRGGAYLRNGSNPLHQPVAGYHYFDGHGMLHSVKFSEDPNKAPVYCARYTKTSKYLQEKAAGKPIFLNALGDTAGYGGLARLGLFAMRTALGLVDIFNGMGTSNAGMAFYNGRILAMSEEDLPYVVKLTQEGDLETIGRYNFNNELFLPMCAHPKLDPHTGQLFAFGLIPVVIPHVRFFWATPDGKKSPDFIVNLSGSCLMHDFAITERFAIFPESQILMKPENMLLGKRASIVGDPTKVPRFGVVPRIPGARSSVRWFEVPDWSSFHFLNAWEEGDEIVLLSSRITPVEKTFDETESLVIRLHEVHLDLRSGRSYKQHVCSAGVDFGTINQKYLGRKNRYVYLCNYGPWPKFSGLTKIDLSVPRLPRLVMDGEMDPDLREPCIVAKRRFEPGTFCGEPHFVARVEGDGVEEDDGYVICHVHNEKSGVSELLVMDASSLHTVAAVKMPARVPYGFHGVFVNADELAKQVS